MQRRIERALANLQGVLGNKMNALGDAPAVHRFERDGAHDEQVKRALNEISGFTQDFPPTGTPINNRQECTTVPVNRQGEREGLGVFDEWPEKRMRMRRDGPGEDRKSVV